MLVIPIADVPSQNLSVQLAGQNCQIALQQKSTGFYCNVSVNNALIIGGVICENLNRIVRSLYLGFIGDFIFVDTQGTSDPTTPGLGSRWQLVYLEQSDLPAGEG